MAFRTAAIPLKMAMKTLAIAYNISGCARHDPRRAMIISKDER
jgi:hypothetical protein